MRLRVFSPIASAMVCLASLGHAQTFTRITDPANPIVTDLRSSGGGCWVDLVGDGYLDLFVPNGNLANQPNALFRNDRAGGWVKVVTGPVVGDGGSSIGGTVGDFDGDGRVDLFVTNRNNFGNFLYRGLGDTAFAKVTTGPPVTDIANSNSSSWVDIDRDGDLDLYVVNFQGNDFLYVNGGAPDFAFTRVDTTVTTPGTEFSIPGGWGDVNNDGYPDLYVGIAGNQNDYLFLNHGGLFFTKTIVADALTTLGLSWGDVDNDGDLDLFLAHYLNQKSTLYRNAGAPGFALVPDAATIVSNETGNWVGSAFGDYDNDGALDLFVARDGGGPGALYHNDGPPAYGFTKVTTEPPAMETFSAFGAVWGDYDRDGQLDLFVADHTGLGNHLYKNGGNANHWVTVRCRGVTPNRSGIGARVRVTATIGGATRTQMREVAGQTGYNSQNLDQHFGLGDAAVIDSLVIDWPSGHRDTWAGLTPDAVLMLDEGTGTVAVDPPGSSPSTRVSMSASPNPLRLETELRFALPRDAHVRLTVFDVRGRRVITPLDGWRSAGSHAERVALPAGAAPGVYVARLEVDDEAATLRLAVVR